MAKKADILWKGILEDVFEDFLCFIYPSARGIIDFSKEPEFLDKELEQVFPPEKDQFSPKVVDKLVKYVNFEQRKLTISLNRIYKPLLKKRQQWV